MSRVKTPWQTTCLVCHALITNYGSGKPKTLCSIQCKKARNRETQKLHYHNVIKPARKLKPRKIHARGPTKLTQDTARHRSIMAAEKLKRGKCAYHLRYFGSELFVTHDLMHVFEFDHIDRELKTHSKEKRGGGVSRLIARVTDSELIAEMDKCELVCCNCHRLKTIHNRDWAKTRNQIDELQLQIQLQ
jgi:hypothetical protein